MRLIDRYILLQTATPLGVSLAVVLAVLVLERVLRLFDLVAQHGKPFGPVLTMAVNLVPHYLGLALPAAFFTSIFLVTARFSEDSELDALRGCGLSIRRFARPLLGLGLLLTLFSIVLYGYVQPYSRYAYRAIFHAVTNAPWDASLVTGTFIDAGDGYTFYADRLDSADQRLEGVFVHERQDDGGEIITTARHGDLQVSDDGTRMTILLQDAVQIRRTPDRHDAVLAFDRLLLGRPFTLEGPLFRVRGDSERELTLTELRDDRTDPPPTIPRARLTAEFHARLVRSASLLVLPMLAVPMGMAAKRTFRWQGIAVAAVILLLYHHTIQFGESLAHLGRVDPLFSLWGPFAVFAAGCGVLFANTERRAGANPFDALYEGLEGFVRPVLRLVQRRRAPT
ncbi:LptF/LptG family permease [Azospirillum doebereinerae]